MLYLQSVSNYTSQITQFLPAVNLSELPTLASQQLVHLARDHWIPLTITFTAITLTAAYKCCSSHKAAVFVLKSGENLENLQDLPESEFKLRLGRVMAWWMTKIAQSNHDVGQNVLQHKISDGFWYAQDLLDALKMANQEQTLAWFKKDNKCMGGLISSAHFDPGYTADGSIVQNCFIVKPGIKASEALDAAFTNTVVTDCGGACQIARYATLREVLGDDKFNRLFSSEVGQPMNLGYDISDEITQPMSLFVGFTEVVVRAAQGNSGAEGNRPVNVGELVLIRGPKDGNKLKPLSIWNNINVVCNNSNPGNQTFIGMGLHPAGLTEVALGSRLLEGFNNPEKPFDRVDPDTLEVHRTAYPLAEKHWNYQAENVLGYDAGSPQFFKTELIRDLIKLPLEEVTMDYVRTHALNTQKLSLNFLARK